MPIRFLLTLPHFRPAQENVMSLECHPLKARKQLLYINELRSILNGPCNVNSGSLVFLNFASFCLDSSFYFTILIRFLKSRVFEEKQATAPVPILGEYKYVLKLRQAAHWIEHDTAGQAVLISQSALGYTGLSHTASDRTRQGLVLSAQFSSDGQTPQDKQICACARFQTSVTQTTRLQESPKLLESTVNSLRCHYQLCIG